MIPVVGINYNFQPILVTDVADAIVQAIETKNNEGNEQPSPDATFYV